MFLPYHFLWRENILTDPQVCCRGKKSDFFFDKSNYIIYLWVETIVLLIERAPQSFQVLSLKKKKKERF